MNNEKKLVNIRYQNGINKAIAENEILHELLATHDFVESKSPDFILFGPYGNDVPPVGNYVRIGYFCENMVPDFSTCEWAFGIMPEDLIRNERYKRIQWHGFDPALLIKKNGDQSPSLTGDKRFCNFFYSNPVRYRERFFRLVSSYKKVDAPGLSMRNMASIDDQFTGDKWERKRLFLQQYKFTLAFENYIYPGYQTEKLYDAMLAGSIPVYCGDPLIGKLFNTRSFINVMDFSSRKFDRVISWLQKLSQPDFTDLRPAYFTGIKSRLSRKVKSWGRSVAMFLQVKSIDFDAVLQRIIELDTNDEKYEAMHAEPWLKENSLQNEQSLEERWRVIFNSKEK